MTPHDPPDRKPERVLLLSADIGEGHNATARATEEALRRLWPGCETLRLDTLKVMGPGVGPLFRWIYVRNVESTPWLYDLFYNALWRQRWFADASRGFVGAWVGPLLRRRIRDHAPDVVVSTYPMATAGLDRLRRGGELAEVPVSAIVSDFCPHPFWVYPEIDLHYVMSRASLRALHRAQPDAAGAVCVPPVSGDFRPVAKETARGSAGVPVAGFQLLVACGSLSFGAVERAVDTALAEPGIDHIVVACGRNEQLRRRLLERPDPTGKLLPLGWRDDMPELTAAADLVLSNAGGATALEAMACGRTVLMFEPIAGHGRANAELMARAGLAELCHDTDELAKTLHDLSTDGQRLDRREREVLRHATSGDFTEQVSRLAHLPLHRGRRGLRAQDRFFVHAAEAAVPQQTGAILRLDGAPEGSTARDWAGHLAELIERRARQLPVLRNVLVQRRLRAPSWYTAPRIEPWQHLDHRDTDEHEASGVIREFFTSAVRTDRPPWQLMVLRTPERTLILAKLHHALGDGIAVTSTLVRLLRDDGDRGEQHAEAAKRQGKSAAGSALPTLLSSRFREVRTAARGFLSLAKAGPAPDGPLNGPSTPGRSFDSVELPMREVRAAARAHGVPRSVLLIALVAESLHRVLDEHEGTTSGQRMRVMVPRTTRTPRENATPEVFGNHTVAVSVDLPVGPMSPAERLERVTRLLQDSQRSGQPLAAGIVMSALGLLPTPLHRGIVRTIYQRRFFNAIVSAMPGSPRPPRVWGALVAGVVPILPLASGVGAAVGVISWGEMVGIGVTVDAHSGRLAERLGQRTREVLAELSSSPSGPEISRPIPEGRG
ncbi:WS/DGAT/MGAT family acyltransferase [Actinopolyspora biskrensis]|uniref:WS/DGAT/MGAT family acyltransferase n=1 Tax=Actinopolyspora biskrensis TaxID=1470178 RepID=A0A852ZDZ7_9ACTN|nr:WS/DGAT/MGAT family acyltransferase [Actinopolyspora biskrensis]